MKRHVVPQKQQCSMWKSVRHVIQSSSDTKPPSGDDLCEDVRQANKRNGGDDSCLEWVMHEQVLIPATYSSDLFPYLGNISPILSIYVRVFQRLDESQSARLTCDGG
mmetsp:Transcript_11768/g.20208  ORF Transcript_11768/g.20208 Transcript_11768/m.20208 type:complete len:107 (+) Transcript_11768:160-480(+)